MLFCAPGIRVLLQVIVVYSSFAASSHLHAAVQKLRYHAFTLPDGFVVEEVAGSPLVHRPIVADLDAQGRLYVADSSGSNVRVEQQLAEKPHRIVRLEDVDHDGIYDESVTFAEGLMFPEGILCFGGAVYCGAPPEIWKLEDLDGDGVADRREVWFDGKTLTGCANDIHGPYLGRDGWIYWAKGAFAEQTHTLFNGRRVQDSAAHIFRCLPDLSEFDVVMSGGMDNPVELVFDNSGELFFTTTFISHPRAGKRDALVHALYGGVYPKEHGVLDGLPRTGDYLPAMTHLGPAAPSGLLRYESSVFGQEYQGNLFSTQFNLRRIQRHQLIENGATFRTHDSDFLVSSHHDFHPTDVLEDGDGSLLVVDTGGWYKLCCPTSQLYKPDVMGSIYRVRKEEGEKVSDPHGNGLDWSHMSIPEVVSLLDDDRPRVQQRAKQWIAAKGKPVIPLLRQCLLEGTTSERFKQQVVWVLTLIHIPEAREAVRVALTSKLSTVLRAAIHSVGIHHDKNAAQALMPLLHHSDPHVCRKAAVALGRIGEGNMARPMLEATRSIKDRSHEHALIHALIQMRPDPDWLKETLEQKKNVALRRVILIVLSQLPGDQLLASDIVKLLRDESQIMRETALWVVGFHPEWGDTLADYFAEELLLPSSNEEIEGIFGEAMVRFIDHPSVQHRMAQLLDGDRIPDKVKGRVLKVMGLEQVSVPPAPWVHGVARLLQQGSETLAMAAIEATRDWNPPDSPPSEWIQALKAAWNRPHLSTSAKLQLLQLIAYLEEPLTEVYFQWLLDTYVSAESSLSRDIILNVLDHGKWVDVDRRYALLKLFSISGPLHLSRLLEFFHDARDVTLGNRFMQTFAEAPARSSVRADLLLYSVNSFPESVRQAARQWLASMEIDLAGQRERLDRMMDLLPAGDVRRGQAVFKSEHAACAECHQVGYVGGQAGPDLTRIGAVRTRRDLLEAVLYPSASFVRSYEPMLVETLDGEMYSGVLHLDAGDHIRIVNGAHSHVRVPRDQIMSMRPGQVSLMPAGLDQLLSVEQLADLLAFLQSRQ